MAECPFSVSIVSTNEGCKPNLILCSRVRHLCAEYNINLTTNHCRADVIVISTCGFSASLEESTIRQTVYSLLCVNGSQRTQKKMGRKVFSSIVGIGSIF
ncbi:hypothetical protein JXQ70_00490 [bacterium]|nr:hypothetical protein [bacterium]